VRVVEVLLGALVPSAVPIDLVIRHREELLPQLEDQAGLFPHESLPVGVAHGEVHLPAVAPETTCTKTSGSERLGALYARLFWTDLDACTDLAEGRCAGMDSVVQVPALALPGNEFLVSDETDGCERRGWIHNSMF
jgi:hypothetical protein